MEYLYEKKIYACGTEHFGTNNYTAVIQWKDTKVITALSTAHHPSVTEVVRQKQKNGEQISVVCPQALYHYNKYIGRVDHFDKFNSTCSVSRKSKKWWLRLFYFTIEAGLVKSYIPYRSVKHKNGDCIESHKHFNLSVARYLL